MNLPHRRKGRPRGRQQLGLVGDPADDGQTITEALHAADYDGATWNTPAAASTSAVKFDFKGASDLGVMPEGVIAIKETGRDTQPLAKLRAQSPPAFGHAGYAPDATGPLDIIPMAPAIGDALAHDDQWGPKFAPVPCGHCGTPPPIPDGILDRARAIGHVNWRAYQAGWKYDTDLILTCPKCQEGDDWKARQGQLEVPGGPRRAAVLAVDVMLTSQTYPDTRDLFEAVERRNARRFRFIRRGRHTGGTR